MGCGGMLAGMRWGYDGMWWGCGGDAGGMLVGIWWGGGGDVGGCWWGCGWMLVGCDGMWRVVIGFKFLDNSQHEHDGAAEAREEESL